MLPVVAAPQVVARKIVIYSWIMVATTLALMPYAGLDLRGVRGRARRLVPGRGAPHARPGRFRRSARRPMKLFHLSIGYLTLLFLAVAVSAVLPWGRF